MSTRSRRPIIGITMDSTDEPGRYMSPMGYAESVEKAGGLPWLLPYRLDLSVIPELVDRLDGALFSGGDDLDPSSWNEPRHPKASAVDPLRERFERALLAEVERRRVPALGICLGCQLINVHRGGSLHQFIPDLDPQREQEHRRLNDWGRRHPAHFEPDSIVAKATGATDLIVNTSHKQAIHDVGKGLRVVGKSPDGIVEGIEDPTFPLFVGVQWHPERMTDRPEHLALFKLLVDRSRENVRIE